MKVSKEFWDDAKQVSRSGHPFTPTNHVLYEEKIMDEHFLKKYNGIPLWMYLEKIDILGKNQWVIRNHFDLKMLTPEITNQVMLDLVINPLGSVGEFEVEVWAHNLTDVFTSFQFDFDGYHGDFLVLPEGVDFTGVKIGSAFPDGKWYIGSQREDGHEKEGLLGAGSGWKFEPDGEPLHLATGYFTGPNEKASEIVLRRAGISYYGMKHIIIQTPRVFPGS